MVFDFKGTFSWIQKKKTVQRGPDPRDRGWGPGHFAGQLSGIQIQIQKVQLLHRGADLRATLFPLCHTVVTNTWNDGTFEVYCMSLFRKKWNDDKLMFDDSTGLQRDVTISRFKILSVRNDPLVECPRNGDRKPRISSKSSKTGELGLVEPASCFCLCICFLLFCFCCFVVFCCL